MKIFKRIMKIAAALLVMAVIFCTASFLLVQTSIGGEMHVRNFYREPKNSLDVVLIGASEMYSGYSAPLSYKNAGFTSYNLCYEGAPGSVYKSMLCEAEKRQNPKLAVVEINGFLCSKKAMKEEARLRKWLDSIPVSANWFNTINENVESGERLPFYFNIMKYHSNWLRVNKIGGRLKALGTINKQGVSLMKSFSTKTTMDEKIRGKKFPPRKIDKNGEAVLDDFAKYCKSSEIDNVLFIRTPHCVKLDSKYDDIISKTVGKYGFEYVNFEKNFDDMQLDPKTDFYNLEHLNVFGCRKFTKYFSDFIKEKYNLKGNYSSEIKEQWQKCVDYTENAFRTLEERTLKKEGKYYYEFSDFSKQGMVIEN